MEAGYRGLLRIRDELKAAAARRGFVAVPTGIKATASLSASNRPVETRNVIGVVPACENMPSGTAYRPADVIRARSGKTIEIISTDAEGRMTLADALAYVDGPQLQGAKAEIGAKVLLHALDENGDKRLQRSEVRGFALDVLEVGRPLKDSLYPPSAGPDPVPPGYPDGATITALRPFSALMILLAGVAAGLVDGVTAHTTPTGRAISTMPARSCAARRIVSPTV